MKVFIGWSKEQSKHVGEAIRDLLLHTLPSVVEPWLSTHDILSGASWWDEIVKQLEQCRLGIICVTRENLEEPWIFFEAGALSKAVKRRGLVCPYLFGPSQDALKGGPLQFFQACSFEKQSTFRLISDINTHAGNGLSSPELRRAFDGNWPGFEGRLRVLEGMLPSRPALSQGDWCKLAPLEFTFIWGDLTESLFEPRQVRLVRTDDKWAPPKEVAGRVWQIAYEKAEFAAKNHRDFHFRPLLRVSSAELVQDGSLTLTLGLTMYLQFAATNLSWKEGATLQAALKGRAPDLSAQACQRYLSSPLNVIGCVVSNDSYLVIPKRGRDVFERPTRYQASVGGFVEQTDDSAESAFTRETDEELGIHAEEISEVSFLGFGYNENTGEPDLLILANCALSGDEIVARFNAKKEQRLQSGKAQGELSELSMWRLKREELPALFKSVCCFDDWSQPSDRAAVIGSVCRKLGSNVVLKALNSWHPRAS